MYDYVKLENGLFVELRETGGEFRFDVVAPDGWRLDGGEGYGTFDEALLAGIERGNEMIVKETNNNKLSEVNK